MATETDLAPPSLRLYTIDEAAVLLHCSKDFLYDLVRGRVVPCSKIGRRLLFSEDHLRAAIKYFERPAVKR